MALINCPECKGTVSDLAYSCPHCGYPFKQPSVPKNPKPKYRRLPNGFGTIKKLSGVRRKPYVAYPSVTEYSDKGYPLYKGAIGYFETYKDAYESLIAYNKNPYDVSANTKTFADVYKEFYNDKFTDAKKNYSKSSIVSTNSAYNNLSALHKRPIRNLRTAEMQKAIDDCTLKHASLEQMLFLLKSVFKFALQRDYIDRDYAQFVRIKIEDDDEKGVPFTEEELKILWDNQDKYAVKILLILIYTGFRITELEKAEINMEEEYFKGGIKTKASKNRIVPFHKKIIPLLDALSEMPFKANVFRTSILYPTLTEIGLENAPTGEKHTPHDCRHTFSWLADKYKIDTVTKHMLMGHSLVTNGVEDSVYGHRSIAELRKAINKIK